MIMSDTRIANICTMDFNSIRTVAYAYNNCAYAIVQMELEVGFLLLLFYIVM